MLIRSVSPRDVAVIRRLWSESLVLDGTGRPPPGLEAVCLDWHLGLGRYHARVLESLGVVSGYVLVCVDQSSHDRASREAALRALPRALGFGAGPAIRMARAASGLTASGRPKAHAHLLIDHCVEPRAAVSLLVGHVDSEILKGESRSWRGDLVGPGCGAEILGSIGISGARSVPVPSAEPLVERVRFGRAAPRRAVRPVAL